MHRAIVFTWSHVDLVSSRYEPRLYLHISSCSFCFNILIMPFSYLKHEIFPLSLLSSSLLDLQFDVSAIDVFAPFARAALLQMLGPSPPMRTLGKARHPVPPPASSSTQDEDDDEGEKKGGEREGGLSRTMSAPAESPSLSSSSSSTASSPANNNNMHRSSSPVDSSSSSGSPSSHRKVALKARGKGHSPPAPPSPSTAAASAPVAAAAAPVASLWSPSRLVALLPLDPSAFELIEAMAGWAMDHTPVGDALLHLAGTFHYYM